VKLLKTIDLKKVEVKTLKNVIKRDKNKNRHFRMALVLKLIFYEIAENC